jgi:hypothetical protein
MREELVFSVGVAQCLIWIQPHDRHVVSIQGRQEDRRAGKEGGMLETFSKKKKM